MKNYKIQISYNVCGLGKDNTDYYIKAIESILNQNFDSFHVVLSSCLNTRTQRNKLRNHFKDKISYCFIDELVPVPISHNISVLQYIKYFEEARFYCYVDSGIDFKEDKLILQKLYNLANNGPYGLISARANSDMGQGTVLPKEFDEIILKNDYIIPLGTATNAHLFLMHND